MKEYQSLSHTRWDCKYHMVFIPKRRKKTVFGVLRKHLGRIFREFARHKESEVVEGHAPGHRQRAAQCELRWCGELAGSWDGRCQRIADRQLYGNRDVSLGSKV